MNPHILNISFFTSEENLGVLGEALHTCISPHTAGVEHLWLRMEKMQGMTPTADEPRSIALQCRFADEAALNLFRNGKLQEGISALHKVLSPQQCMVFETNLLQIEL